MLQTGLGKQLSEVVLDQGGITDGHVGRKGSPDTSITVRRGIGKKLGRRLNVQRFRQDDLVARPRGFQIRDHLGVRDKSVDEFRFYRQLQWDVLDRQREVYVVQDLRRKPRAPERNGTPDIDWQR
jgi:hypothetical protein